MIFLNKHKEFLKRWEGWKITNDPDDPGGYTAFGISKKYHPDAKIFKLIDSGVTDTRVLEAAAVAFYTELAANTIGLELLPEIYKFSYFDLSINAGVDDACLCWQQTVNFFFPGLLVEDGDFGKRTKSATYSKFGDLDNEIGFLVYQNFRLGNYIDKVSLNPKKVKFIVGWKNRTNHLTSISINR